MRSFASHGVTHYDLRKDNIIFSQQPSRVVIIDFGASGFRRNKPDSKWESAVTKKGGETRLKQLLHKAGIGYLDPCFPKIFPNPRGTDYWNSLVEREGQRWCIGRVPVGSDLMHDEPMRWKLRDNVVSWLTAKPGFKVGWRRRSKSWLT